jgi:hypothetical protein
MSASLGGGRASLDQLWVGLNSWIIQDGNYGDFAVGEVASFALEFYSESGLSPVAPGQKTLLRDGDSFYIVTALVMHVEPDWWVIDAGLPMYCEEPPPNDVSPGNWVSGRVSIGIDPFFYFESLAQRSGSPPLVFDWMVEGIEIETSPLVEIAPRTFARDSAQMGRTAIDRTNAWSDDDGNADYLLKCRRLDHPPRRGLWRL